MKWAISLEPSVYYFDNAILGHFETLMARRCFLVARSRQAMAAIACLAPHFPDMCALQTHGRVLAWPFLALRLATAHVPGLETLVEGSTLARLLWRTHPSRTHRYGATKMHRHIVALEAALLASHPAPWLGLACLHLALFRLDWSGTPGLAFGWGQLGLTLLSDSCPPEYLKSFSVQATAAQVRTISPIMRAVPCLAAAAICRLLASVANTAGYIKLATSSKDASTDQQIRGWKAYAGACWRRTAATLAACHPDRILGAVPLVAEQAATAAWVHASAQEFEGGESSSPNGASARFAGLQPPTTAAEPPTASAPASESAASGAAVAAEAPPSGHVNVPTESQTWLSGVADDAAHMAWMAGHPGHAGEVEAEVVAHAGSAGPDGERCKQLGRLSLRTQSLSANFASTADGQRHHATQRAAWAALPRHTRGRDAWLRFRGSLDALGADLAMMAAVAQEGEAGVRDLAALPSLRMQAVEMDALDEAAAADHDSARSRKRAPPAAGLNCRAASDGRITPYCTPLGSLLVTLGRPAPLADPSKLLSHSILGRPVSVPAETEPAGATGGEPSSGGKSTQLPACLTLEQLHLGAEARTEAALMVWGFDVDGGVHSGTQHEDATCGLLPRVAPAMATLSAAAEQVRRSIAVSEAMVPTTEQARRMLAAAQECRVLGHTRSAAIKSRTQLESDEEQRLWAELDADPPEDMNIMSMVTLPRHVEVPAASWVGWGWPFLAMDGNGAYFRGMSPMDRPAELGHQKAQMLALAGSRAATKRCTGQAAVALRVASSVRDSFFHESSIPAVHDTAEGDVRATFLASCGLAHAPVATLRAYNLLRETAQCLGRYLLPEVADRLPRQRRRPAAAGRELAGLLPRGGPPRAGRDDDDAAAATTTTPAAAAAAATTASGAEAAVSRAPATAVPDSPPVASGRPAGVTGAADSSSSTTSRQDNAAPAPGAASPSGPMPGRDRRLCEAFADPSDPLHHAVAPAWPRDQVVLDAMRRLPHEECPAGPRVNVPVAASLPSLTWPPMLRRLYQLAYAQHALEARSYRARHCVSNMHHLCLREAVWQGVCGAVAALQAARPAMQPDTPELRCTGRLHLAPALARTDWALVAVALPPVSDAEAGTLRLFQPSELASTLPPLPADLRVSPPLASISAPRDPPGVAPWVLAPYPDFQLLRPAAPSPRRSRFEAEIRAAIDRESAFAGRGTLVLGSRYGFPAPGSTEWWGSMPARNLEKRSQGVRIDEMVGGKNGRTAPVMVPFGRAGGTSGFLALLASTSALMVDDMDLSEACLRVYACCLEAASAQRAGHIAILLSTGFDTLARKLTREYAEGRAQDADATGGLGVSPAGEGASARSSRAARRSAHEQVQRLGESKPGEGVGAAPAADAGASAEPVSPSGMTEQDLADELVSQNCDREGPLPGITRHVMAAMESVRPSPSGQLAAVSLKLLRSESTEDFRVAEAGLTELLASISPGSERDDARQAAVIEAEAESVALELGLPSSFASARLAIDHLVEGPAVPYSRPTNTVLPGLKHTDVHLTMMRRACKAALALTTLGRTFQEYLFILTKFKGMGTLWTGRAAPRAAQRAADAAIATLVAALIAVAEPVKALGAAHLPLTATCLLPVFSGLVRRAQAAVIMVCRMKGWRDLSASGNPTLAATTELLMELGVLMSTRMEACAPMQTGSKRRLLAFHELFGGWLCTCATQTCPHIGTMPWMMGKRAAIGHMLLEEWGDDDPLPNLLDHEPIQPPWHPQAEAASPHAPPASASSSAVSEARADDVAGQPKKSGKKGKKGKVVRKKGKKGK